MFHSIDGSTRTLSFTDYDIYLEHFALNENNEAPSFFKNKDEYYQQYLKKKELHKINKTKLKNELNN